MGVSRRTTTTPGRPERTPATARVKRPVAVAKAVAVALGVELTLAMVAAGVGEWEGGSMEAMVAWEEEEEEVWEVATRAMATNLGEWAVEEAACRWGTSLSLCVAFRVSSGVIPHADVLFWRR